MRPFVPSESPLAPSTPYQSPALSHIISRPQQLPLKRPFVPSTPSLPQQSPPFVPSESHVAPSTPCQSPLSLSQSELSSSTHYEQDYLLSSFDWDQSTDDDDEFPSYFPLERASKSDSECMLLSEKRPAKTSTSRSDTEYPTQPAVTAIARDSAYGSTSGSGYDMMLPPKRPPPSFEASRVSAYDSDCILLSEKRPARVSTARSDTEYMYLTKPALKAIARDSACSSSGSVDMLPPKVPQPPFKTPPKLQPVEYVLKNFPGKEVAILRNLTTALARDAIFGRAELAKLSGRKNTVPLPSEKLDYIKTLVRSRVPEKSAVEFEWIWSLCRASLSKSCQGVRTNARKRC